MVGHRETRAGAGRNAAKARDILSKEGKALVAGRVVAGLSAAGLPLGVAQSIVEIVRHLRHFGAVLLLLLSCVAPAMACMAPASPMTAEEQACCRMMKSQCGQMEMPASHPCCKKVAADVQANTLKTDTVSFHPAVTAVFWVSSFDFLNAQSASRNWVQRPEHSPPKAPPSAIIVLRI